MIMRGYSHCFGDNISTDHIAPGRYYHLRSDLNALARHVLSDADPEFASRVKPGDFVVAGENFGLGSSREHAPAIIKIAGIQAILATSVARIFFRNAINVGLPVLICDTSAIESGDELALDLVQGTVTNLTRGGIVNATPLPPVMLRILEDGGLVRHVTKHGRIAAADRGETDG